MNSFVKKFVFLLLFISGLLLFCYQNTYAVVTLIYFTATPGDLQIRLEWETATEFDNAGFYISRSTTENGEYVRISDFIPSEGIGPIGAKYQYFDTEVVNGTTYFYILESINVDQTIETYGPISTTAGLQTDTPSPSPTLPPTEISTSSLGVTDTPVNSSTATATQTKVSSATSIHTKTFTPSSTYTKSATSVPTKKPSSTLTPTKTKINTPTVTPTNTSTIVPSPTLVPLPSIVISYLPTRTVVDNHIIKESIPKEQELNNNSDNVNSHDNKIKRIIVALVIILWIIISIGLFMVFNKKIG